MSTPATYMTSYNYRATLSTRALPCGAIQYDLRVTYVFHGMNYNGQRKSTTCCVFIASRVALLVASCKSGGILRLKKSIFHVVPHIVGHYMPYIMSSHFIVRMKAHLRASHIVAALKTHFAIIGILSHHHEQLKVRYKAVRFIQCSKSLPEI